MRDAEPWAGQYEPLTQRRREGPRTSLDSFDSRQRRKLAQAVDSLHGRLSSRQQGDLEQLVRLVRHGDIDPVTAQRVLADVEASLAPSQQVAA